LQKVTAEQLNLSPILMGAANSAGGVMGKMIDAQSIVVSSSGHPTAGQRGRDLQSRLLAQHRAGFAGRADRDDLCVCDAVGDSALISSQ
jgi:L-lactate permease